MSLRPCRHPRPQGLVQAGAYGLLLTSRLELLGWGFIGERQTPLHVCRILVL